MFLLTSGGTALSLPVTSCIIHRVRGIWEQFWGRLHPFEVIFNKNNLISTVSFIAFQWYCYKCEESGEHYWVSVHPHWLYGVMCPNECKGPGEQFGCLHMRLGTRLSDCAGPGSSLGFVHEQSVHGSSDQMTSKTCKLGHVANLKNRSYCLCCSVIGYILY